MAIPHVDVHAQYAPLIPELKEAFAKTLESARFIFGPEVEAFERESAEKLGVQDTVSCANGTDALVLVMDAMEIGPGDEVICPAFTFYATAEAIARRGATPVFADIDPVSLCLDPDAAEAAITERTRAVMPVHIFGQTADLRAFRELADRHGIALIEDAAQAFGATFEGYRAGSYGDVATFSFFPTKNFPAMGDAGMAIASSEEIAEKVRLLRFHGSRDKRVFEQIGVNSRLDEMQAVILRRFLPEVDGWNEGRMAAAARYRELGLGEHVSLPEVAPGRSHIYHLYVVRTPAREQLQRRLKEAGVASAVYYGQPHHLQPVFRHLGYREGSLPVTEAASREGLALPMFPTLVEEQQREVVNAVRGAASAAA